MRGVRFTAMAFLTVVTLGSLVLTGGNAWHVRSAAYRNSCARALSKALGLPAEIGRVVPRSRQAREYDQVRIWLPQRRGEAAFCERAVLTRRPTADQPRAYELDLEGGRCEVSARTWLREDYRLMLESGLRPGFSPAGPRRIRLSDMDLAFERDRFRMTLQGASGLVAFDQPDLGRATLWCGRLNGYAAASPVTLQAQFAPQAAGVRLDLVRLKVPELPVASLGLDNLAGLDLKSGTFGGEVVYQETEAGHELTVSGRTTQVDLSECTGSFLKRPWHGGVPELELQELTLVNDRPERLRFHGVVTKLAVGDVLAPWGLGETGGTATLRIEAADLSPAGIEHLVAAGRCEDLDLAKISQAAGWGQMTGHARLVIDDLTIDQNRLTSLDAEIRVEPPTTGANTIDRTLVSEVLRRTIGVPLPSFLPDRFEYAQLGVRLEVRDEVLYLLGTHGPQQKAILSVRVGGEEVPALLAPETPIELRAGLDRLRDSLHAAITEGLRRLAAHTARPGHAAASMER